MTARLASGVLISGLLRRVQQAGGFGTVLWRGDADAGGVLVACRDRGTAGHLLELGRDFDGHLQWRVAGPSDMNERDDYILSRRKHDADLWLIELDIPDAARFAAETIASG